MTRRNQLFGLCAHASRAINEPFAVEWAGDDWDCVTDGRAALLIRGATWPVKDGAPDVGQVIPNHASDLTVSGLLDWSFGEAEVCGMCSGDETYHENGADYPCGCDRGLPRNSYGIVGPVTFNRRMIHRFLLRGSVYAPSDEHVIRWDCKADPILIQDSAADPSLLLVVMPMNHAPEDPAPISEIAIGE